MKIQEIKVFVIKIPFKEPFRHALASRQFAENIVVQLITDEGIMGFGEGVPRDYVTGETIDSCLDMIARILSSFIWNQTWKTKEDVLDFLIKWGAQIEERLGGSQEKVSAARCALELALLDAAGKTFRCCVTELLDWKKENKPQFYSGVLSSGSLWKVSYKTFLMRLFGFKAVKLKVGAVDDIKKIERVRHILGPGVDLRLDANGAWTADEAIQKINSFKCFGVTAVEQPVAQSDLIGMQEVVRQTQIDIVADESFCGLESARILLQAKGCDILNVRLSKCGGLYIAGEIAKLALRYGKQIQLGCQVGETALLSSAGRLFAQSHPQLKYLEGSYERFLLEQDISKNRICFGYKGTGRPIHGFGLDVDVDQKQIDKFTQNYMVLKK